MHCSCPADHRVLQEDVFFRINAERFHIRWRSEVRPSSRVGPAIPAYALPTLQLMRKFAEDLYNVHVATVFGIILDLAENDVHGMEDSDSRAFSLLSSCFPIDTLTFSQAPSP